MCTWRVRVCVHVRIRVRVRVIVWVRVVDVYAVQLMKPSAQSV